MPLGNVAVIGAGAIGLLCGFTARLLGANHVYLLDNNPLQVAQVAALGFDGAVDSTSESSIAAMKAATRGKGIDIVIDAAGFTVTRALAKAIVNSGGTIMNIGLGHAETPLPINDMIRSETNVLGSFCYTPQDFADALQLLTAGKVTEEGWTIERPLEEGPLSFQRLVRAEIQQGKIILAV
ncbi:zinc-binding dehydrogenase [Paenibacillus taihuensis]|uniref:Zinc-binding dehydrogenase n=1 Tax=Paenibacillus taihuensis TaxID=1156355 RepID=A0A3D9R5S8_9BACL|nr:zinc-binding dehydrogenase [Paenibacillus taihuensis]